MTAGELVNAAPDIYWQSVDNESQYMTLYSTMDPEIEREEELAKVPRQLQ
jgi:hypothetical protein